MAEYERPTFTEILSSLIANGKSTLTRIKNWAVGAVVRSTLGVVAKGLDQLYAIIDRVLLLAFYDTSTGAWLERIGILHNRPRKVARKAQGRVIYGREESGGAKNIAAGSIVGTTTTPDGKLLRYKTDEDTTLPDGELEVEVDITAETVGSRYNVGSGAIDQMITSIPGIDYVRNDQEPYWLDTEGTDKEEDEAMQQRMPLVWSELSFPAPGEKYKSVARAILGVSDVYVDINAPRGDGTIDIIIWGDGGAPTPELVETVQTAIDLIKPDLADVLVKAASASTQNIVVNLVKGLGSGEVTAIKAAGETALASLFLPSDNESAYRIAEKFSRAKIYAESIQVPNVSNVDVVIPAEDVDIDPDELAQPGTITVNVVGG